MYIHDLVLNYNCCLLSFVCLGTRPCLPHDNALVDSYLGQPYNRASLV